MRLKIRNPFSVSETTGGRDSALRCPSAVQARKGWGKVNRSLVPPLDAAVTAQRAVPTTVNAYSPFGRGLGLRRAEAAMAAQPGQANCPLYGHSLVDPINVQVGFHDFAVARREPHFADIHIAPGIAQLRGPKPVGRAA